MKKIVSVKGLSKVFETKGKNKKVKAFTAVDNIDFEVEQGEIVGFIGPNGAGKSTTIKMLTGILYPTYGDVVVAGFNPFKERVKMTYHIGTMFGQKSSLLSHLPVIESYKLLGTIYDLDKNVLNERIKEIADFFEINDLLDKKASSLSLGQRMICEVAAVTLHRPDVIFLDEPTIGLDIVVKKKVRDMIKLLNQKYGTTIIITSHDISDIEKLCSRIVLINHGKIIIDDRIENIKHGFLTRKKIIASYEGNINTDLLNKEKNKLDVSLETKEKVVVEFDEEKIKAGKIIELLIKAGTVEDISISNTSLENIIYDIYTNKEVSP